MPNKNKNSSADSNENKLIMIAQGNYTDITLKENLLKNNDIPCFVQSKYGSGYVMRAGNLLENYSLFIDQADLALAQEILEGL